jgi:hypothetical protein
LNTDVAHQVVAMQSGTSTKKAWPQLGDGPKCAPARLAGPVSRGLDATGFLLEAARQAIEPEPP